MLELLLTRPEERDRLITAAHGLRFLVLDELHTYRGRRGADVAMLVRRLRDACAAEQMQCVGTSATMTSEGSEADRRREVAKVATYFHLYSVPRDDVDYVMDTFRAFRNNDPDRFARTKKAILQIYDAMADATRTGRPYRTVLDPPPGHGPRHPAR